jgi:mannose-6-phosphate isomerase
MNLYHTHDLKQPLRLSVDNLTDHMWGGQWIRSFKDLAPSASPVGEAWELSARPEHPSRVEVGAGVSVSLTELVRDHATFILGEKLVRAYGERLPLLTKFIDAADDLSVQVHPDDAHLPAGESGKSESWLILATERGAENGFIYLGFDSMKADAYPTRAAFADAFFDALNQANSMGPRDDAAVRARAERVVLPFLNRVRVKPGDVFNVRPGVVHAIGRGVRLFEIQQASDLTYRVWDWNRPDAKERAAGRLAFRPLHLKEARRVMDFDADAAETGSATLLGENERELVREFKDRFLLTRIDLKPGLEYTLETNGVFQALTIIDGNVALGGVSAQRGRSVLIPAALERVTLRSTAPAVVLRATVPV